VNHSPASPEPAQEDRNATRGEPPLHAIWATLRDRWLKVDAPPPFPAGRRATPGRRSEHLTEYLNRKLGMRYRPQAVSQWATGSDQRNPPWRAILLLLNDLDLDLVISGEGEAWLVKARKRTADA
jgi:hypothetical protein